MLLLDPARFTNVAVLVGVKYGLLPGASGDYFSTPDSAAASITGDIDIRIRAALDDWTPTIEESLLGKWTAAGNKRSYRLAVGTGANLVWYASSDGTTADDNALVSTASILFSNGSAGWVRVTKNSSTGDVIFYTSSDGETWSQLGTTVAGSVFTIHDNASVVEVGAINTGTSTVMSGKVYRAQVYNGINGTLAVDFNSADYGSGSTFVSSTTGETWTLNGSVSITS